MERIVVEFLLGLLAFIGAVTLALVIVVGGLFLIAAFEGLLEYSRISRRVAATLAGTIATAGLLALIWEAGRLMIR